MKRIAVIAEFNPFHTGHAHLLSQLRQQSGPEALLIVIQSGSFVQRGEPALFNKWQRARWAVQNGADLVFELPTVYSLSSAAGFAYGGTLLAARLGCTHLACGVESGTAADFYALARASLQVGQTRPKGETQGRSQTEAIAAQLPQETAALLEEPNALLAAAYVKTIVQHQLPLQFWPIQRSGSHNSSSLDGAFASASALRRTISQTGSSQTIERYLPDSIRTSVAELIEKGAYTDYDRYGDLILFRNRLLSPRELHELPAFNEGLENRWYRCLQGATNYADGLAAIKTRRYAYSRLCRMGAYTLLWPNRQLMDASYEQGPQYARLLALSKPASYYIKEIKKLLPVITLLKKADNLSPLGQQQLALDLRATDVQFYCFHQGAVRLAGQDYYESPKIQ